MSRHGPSFEYERLQYSDGPILSEPTRKISMKIDPYRQQQCSFGILVGNVRFMQIFAGFPEE